MTRPAGWSASRSLAVAVTVVFFAWLYLPILAVALFSFNDEKSLSAFSGFSTRWYDDFFHNSALLESLVRQPADRHRRGARLARARHHAGPRPGADHGPGAAGAIGAVTLLPLVTPEIVTGVAALLLFTGHRPQAVADHGHPRGDHVLDRLRDGDRARAAGQHVASRSRRPPATSAARRGRRCGWSRCPTLVPALLGVRAAGLRAGLRRLRARVLHHRRRPAAAAGADLLLDPVRRLAGHQRGRHPDARWSRHC